MKSILVLSFCLLFVLSCDLFIENQEKPVELDQLNFSGFLFLESFDFITGSITVSSVCSTYSYLNIDFPLYSYNGNTGTLQILHQFSLDSSSPVLIGRGTSISGSVGGGIASGVSDIDSLPFDVSYGDDFCSNRQTYILTDIYQNGTISITMQNGKVLTLPIDSSAEFFDTCTYQPKSGSCPHQVIKMHTFKNHGFLDSSDIILEGGM